MSYYKPYMQLTGKTRQAICSDLAKQAQKPSSKPWGGRYEDGPHDNYKPIQLYTRKKRGKTNRTTYYYPKKVRTKWLSYGRRYK